MKLTKNEYQIIFDTLGSPFCRKKIIKLPPPGYVDKYYKFLFKNRIALYFFEEIKKNGFIFKGNLNENYKQLKKRRLNTNEILVKLTNILNKKYQNQWVFFKTLKPFPSTPNDSDFILFDVKKHDQMCKYLISEGFSLLEKAPLQTTLIDDSGKGLANSDKRGGVWYIDCYKEPGADYFIYMDVEKLKNFKNFKKINGKEIPTLDVCAELSAICFHGIFPERTYSIETFYLILYYLKEIKTDNKVMLFVDFVKNNNMKSAVAANLILTNKIHNIFFLKNLDIVDEVLSNLETYNVMKNKFEYSFPYHFSKRLFFKVLFEKLKEPKSFISLLNQFFHMLNPFFLIGVFIVLYKRLFKKGGIYKQM